MTEAGETRLGRPVQVALALLAGVALLLAGRAVLRRPADQGPLLTASPTPQAVLVHVTGEVVVPGVYRLTPGSRWSDALHAARGPTFLADLHAVNLAQPLRDGDRVFIPQVPEPVPPVETDPGPPQGVPRAAGTAAPLDVNTATVADFEGLPGIGPVLAARIVEHRRTHGRIERLEDLLEVEGIGPRLLERLRPRVRVR